MARDMYDGGVLYTDELLGRIVEAIRARGALDETILIVLADHGEILGEKSGFYGHGPSLYQPGISVPLVMRYPPAVPAGARVDTPVSTVGVFATILDLAGIEAPPTLQVGSLLPLVRGNSASPGPVLSERMKAIAVGGDKMDLGDPQMMGNVRYRALRSGDWKIVETSEGEHFLYDLASDPGERFDLAAERPRELARMQAELVAARIDLGLPELDAELASAALPELDAETQDRLRELGYIE
jgi:arylsulfatase A-like enzyme